LKQEVSYLKLEDLCSNIARDKNLDSLVRPCFHSLVQHKEKKQYSRAIASKGMAMFNVNTKRKSLSGWKSITGELKKKRLQAGFANTAWNMHAKAKFLRLMKQGVTELRRERFLVERGRIFLNQQLVRIS